MFSSVQLLSPVWLCDPVNHSMPGLPVHQQVPEFIQIHVHWVSDGIQPSRPLSSPSPPALNLSQHQGLFQWVSSWHQVAKVLKFQLQHQFFQWTPRTDLLYNGLVLSPCSPKTPWFLFLPKSPLRWTGWIILKFEFPNSGKNMIFLYFVDLCFTNDNIDFLCKSTNNI